MPKYLLGGGRKESLPKQEASYPCKQNWERIRITSHPPRRHQSPGEAKSCTFMQPITLASRGGSKPEWALCRPEVADRLKENKLPLAICSFPALDMAVREGWIMLGTQALFYWKHRGGEMTAHTDFKWCTEVLRSIESKSPKCAIWPTAISEEANECCS